MYNAPLYRPPSEAGSLILQLTLGCSHNSCTFCIMYRDKKFSVKNEFEWQEHVKQAKKYYPKAKRIFLADGNVLTVETNLLKEIIADLYKTFPNLERVTAYAGPKDLLRKSEEELKSLRKTGLQMLYLGVESGSGEVLKRVAKGVTPEQMIEAGQKAKDSGFKLSCTIISGLGGKELYKEHAIETARVISEINPDYLGLLTLLLDDRAPIVKQIEKGKLTLLTPKEIVSETHLLVKNLNLTRCIFRSNHPSNYLSLRGTLNEDKEKIIATLEKAMGFSEEDFRPEHWRAF